MMKIKVICGKCKQKGFQTEFNWFWGATKGHCPRCGAVSVKDIKLAKGEIRKLFQ